MRIRRRSYPIRKLESRPRESGVALIIALLSLLIISTLAAGVMMTTQSEVWTTANQRSMTQARYVAEAGLEQAAFFISNNNGAGSGWVAPTGTHALNTAYYNLKDFPVTFNPTGTYTTSCAVTPANCVIMTAGNIAGISDTYSTIDSTTNSNFTTHTTGTSPFSAQTGNPTYAVAAQLLSAYNDPTAGWITRWKIISQATVGAGSAMPAKVQVVATIQNKILSGSNNTSAPVPSFMYGAWANSTACGAITMSGGSGTDSWNSVSNGGNANPTIARANGNIGTLGNVLLENSAMVDGSISAPNYNLGDPNAANGSKKSSTSTYYPYGVSGGPTWPYWNANNATPEACSATWPYAVNMDNSGSNGFGCTSTSASSCVDKASKLPTGAAAYPTATLPAGAPTTNNTAACNLGPECSGNFGSGALTFSPSNTSYGQVTLGSNDDFYFGAGTYYFDTLTVANSARIHLGVMQNGVFVPQAPVVIYILNGANSSEPINFTGGSQTNQGGDPNNLTFVYNGTKEVHVGSISNNAVFATFYAPNANVTFDGNGNIYGAVIGNTVNITGGGTVNYDTNLANATPHVYSGSAPANAASPFHMDEFSWSAF